MLLYIHVPFCRAKCRYCAFFSLPLSKSDPDDLLEEYTRLLCREIALWADTLGKIALETVFFGGGTPSLLSPGQLERILSSVASAFSLAAGAEISMEANPESFLAPGYAARVARLGFNRLSLGVQSLDDAKLKAVGRPHSRSQAFAACEAARASGIPSINLDLIWGLPGQQCRDWLHELEEITRLSPEHLSCYGLSLEEGTPMERAYNEGRLHLPSEEEQAAMFLEGAAFLEARGYLHYEISNFAKEAFPCRHNLGYWAGADYLGLGPGATSTLASRRWTNPQNLGEWAEQIRNSRPGQGAEKLDGATRQIEMVMLGLRTRQGLSLEKYRALCGRDFAQDNAGLIAGLKREKLLEEKQKHLSLTRQGMLVSNSILERLFSALEEQPPLPPEAKTEG